MPAIFLDCTDDMAPLWQRIRQPGDPAIAVNTCPGQPADIPALLAGYDTCIDDHSYFDAATLARCAGLRRIVFLGTGASSFIDLDAAGRCGIAVDTIKGYGDTTVAEHTIALAMAAARSVARMDREVRAGQWRQIEGVQLFGKTLGIIGLGGIGREVARMAAGLGMQVLAWNRSPAPGADASLDDVLARSDILCLTLALNDATRGFLDAAKLARTKPGVIFVNTARADIVDAAALTRLLESGHIRHAAIDVFAPEPPLPGDPLLALPNVTLTAHAGFMTPEATMTMLRRAVDIVIAAGGVAGMIAKRAAWCLIAATWLLSGCTGGHGSEAHRAQLAALVGTSRAGLVQRFGPPTMESTDEYQSFLTWDDLELDYVSASAGYFYDHGALYGGHTAQPAAARFDCRTIFVLDHDRVTAFNLSGVGCR